MTSYIDIGDAFIVVYAITSKPANYRVLIRAYKLNIQYTKSTKLLSTFFTCGRYCQKSCMRVCIFSLQDQSVTFMQHNIKTVVSRYLLIFNFYYNVSFFISFYKMLELLRRREKHLNIQKNSVKIPIIKSSLWFWWATSATWSEKGRCPQKVFFNFST